MKRFLPLTLSLIFLVTPLFADAAMCKAVGGTRFTSAAVGFNSTNSRAGASFTVSSTCVAGSIGVLVIDTGASIHGHLIAKIEADSAGVPSDVALATTPAYTGLSTSVWAWATSTLATGYTLNTGTTYWLVFDTDNGQSTQQEYDPGLLSTGTNGAHWNGSSWTTGDQSFIINIDGDGIASTPTFNFGLWFFSMTNWQHLLSALFITNNHYAARE